MVVIVVGKNTLCKLILSRDEIKILLEKLDIQKLRELINSDEVFIDSELSKMELEYTKLIVGDKITTEVTIDEETLRLTNRLNTSKIILVTEKITEIAESGITFREPAYYLVTIT